MQDDTGPDAKQEIPAAYIRTTGSMWSDMLRLWIANADKRAQRPSRLLPAKSDAGDDVGLQEAAPAAPDACHVETPREGGLVRVSSQPLLNDLDVEVRSVPDDAVSLVEAAILAEAASPVSPAAAVSGT